jgi:hypothetical protein
MCPYRGMSFGGARLAGRHREVASSHQHQLDIELGKRLRFSTHTDEHKCNEQPRTPQHGHYTSPNTLMQPD